MYVYQYVYTQAGLQVTRFYGQAQIFLTYGGMSEHVCDYFEMEKNPEINNNLH